jgi:hypothetical protein
MIGLVGIIRIVVGFIVKIFPARKINYIYGYITILSMENQKTQKYLYPQLIMCIIL